MNNKYKPFLKAMAAMLSVEFFNEEINAVDIFKSRDLFDTLVYPGDIIYILSSSTLFFSTY